MYFPLPDVVEESLLIEPTETESKETLDQFIEVMKLIAKEAEENPDLLLNAPHTRPTPASTRPSPPADLSCGGAETPSAVSDLSPLPFAGEG